MMDQVDSSSKMEGILRHWGSAKAQVLLLFGKELVPG